MMWMQDCEIMEFWCCCLIRLSGEFYLDSKSYVVVLCFNYIMSECARVKKIAGGILKYYFVHCVFILPSLFEP